MDDEASPLVSPEWLVSWAKAPAGDVRVIDVRWYLSGRKGSEAYAAGHVPGAVFIDLDGDNTARKGPGRHPIPGGGQMERAMRRAGVSATTRVSSPATCMGRPRRRLSA